MQVQPLTVRLQKEDHVPICGVYREPGGIPAFTMQQIHRGCDSTVHSVQIDGGVGNELTIDLAIQR